MAAIDQGTDLLNKLSQALVTVSRGDPIISLRSELQSKFDAIEDRFAGIVEATKLQHDDLVRVPTQVDRAVEGLKDLLLGNLTALEARTNGKLSTSHAELEGQVAASVEKLNGQILITRAEALEKFTGINNQFSQNDKALTAALQAQEKQAIATNDSNTAASTKMEDGFARAITQQSDILTEVRRNYDAQFNEVKSRLDKREGFTNAADPQVTSVLTSLGSTMATMQVEMARSIAKIGDTNSLAIQELAMSLRKVERTEASSKDRGMGRGEIISYITMGILVLSQIVVMFTVFAPHAVPH